MNLSKFSLNLVSSKVTDSSFTVLYRTLISISELSEAIPVSPNGSLVLGINLDKPTCCTFLDGKIPF